ncbi:MAG: hypothetical protein PHF97_03140 [Bacteroidales bacterium]|nr:hypothetical protein [Bacteroidales bacterium]MDD4602789.1 hypothetical protein [Bacteroidales bacterium]
MKNFLIWFFAIVFTLAIAVYQRMTGPSYPVKGTVEIGSQKIKFKLIRTYDGINNAPIKIIAPDTSIKGELTLRRFKSFDTWQTQSMQRHGDTLVGFLPHQAVAGKVMYQVTLIKGDQKFLLNDQPAILRFKGYVPGYVLIPHIFFIFMAMLLSTLTALLVIFRKKNTYVYAWITVICLALGGLILGPIVQKFSFNAYWTGWPFGHDLTDNKSLVAFIFWVIALVVMKKHRENRLWPVLASIVLLVVFLIPHSVMGSEIDYTKEQPAKTINY